VSGRVLKKERGTVFFPIVPLLALVAILGGGVTLVWYDELSKEQKEEADRIAADYAKQLYGKSVKELTRAQGNRVVSLTKGHFSN
jgi:hypothetical protein